MARKWAHEREKEKRERIRQKVQSKQNELWDVGGSADQIVKLPWNPNETPTIVKLPYRIGRDKQQIVPLDFPKKAASGWAQYKSDVANRQTLMHDPGYQKWQKAIGETAQEDWDAHPQPNWSFARNNQFGYLYGENPADAKQFAKLVNAKSNTVPTMISDKPAVEEAEIEEHMGLLGDMWNNYVGTNEANSAAALSSGLQMAEVGKDVFDSVAATEAANADIGKQMGDTAAGAVTDVLGATVKSGGELEATNADVGKTAADTVVEEVPKALQTLVPQPVEPPQTNEPIDIPLPEIGLIGTEDKKDPILLTPMEAMLGKLGDYEEKAALGFRQWKGDRSERLNIENSDGYQAYIDFMTKNNYAGTPEGMAAAQKILGPGYTIEEPQPNWSAAENNRYGYLYYTDPKAAAEYARSVNARYASEDARNTEEWAKDHQGLAQVSTWITDRLDFAETLNSELNYAQYGQVPYTWQVTPSKHSEIVKDAIGEELFGDNLADKAIYDAFYSAGDAAFNAYLAKLYGGVFGVAVDAVDSYSDAYNQALRDAMAWGLSDEEAVAYAREMARSNGVGSVASGMLSENLPSKNGLEAAMGKEIVSSGVGGTVGNGLSAVTKYNAIVDYHIKCGMTQEEAEYWAKYQILQELGEDTFNDLLSGLAFGLGYGLNQ